MNKLLRKLLYSDRFGFANEVRITTYKDGQIVRQSDWIKNVVVLSANNGRNLIMQALSGDYAGSLEITHAELGTGTTAASESDTNTEAGAVRAQRGYVSVADNVLTIKFFFSDTTLADGTYNELTMWMDGTASEGTGHLFNRLMFSSSAYVKATGEDTSVELRATLTG